MTTKPTTTTPSGPLRGVRIVEMGGIGPGPFAAMLLSDLGADVVRVDRITPPEQRVSINEGPENLLLRGRPSIAVDVKSDAGREVVLRLCESADALIEGFRPGVMERLGLGPDQVLTRNPRLVYGRMTGYGQEGPLSRVAGHDVNYIAVSGVLDLMARRGERPLPPLNLVGDFGGGSMFLALGIVAGILEARSSGEGQVVDAAMVDGSALLATMFHGFLACGFWDPEPGTNLLDTGAHFYEVYRTADGGHVAVGAIEPQFYAELLRLLELDPAEYPQWDRPRWPELKERFAEIFAGRSRDAWAELLEPADACATAVYHAQEAPDHPQMLARGTFVTIDGVRQPGPAPRFSRTPGAVQSPAPPLGSGTDPALAAWGFGDDERARLREAGVID